MATLEEKAQFYRNHWAKSTHLFFILSCVATMHWLKISSGFGKIAMVPHILNDTFRNWVILSKWELSYGHPWDVCVWGWGVVLRGFCLTNLSLVSIFCCSNCCFSEFQVIPVAYIVYHVKCACLFEPTWHIRPFSSPNALSWVQIHFFISFCTIVQYPCAHLGQVSTE